jgi:hypothetical protein
VGRGYTILLGRVETLILYGLGRLKRHQPFLYLGYFPVLFPKGMRLLLLDFPTRYFLDKLQLVAGF